MMYFGPGMSGWMMALMIFGNVAFWVVVILGAVVVARSLRKDSLSASGTPDKTPQRLLAERFARGELTEDDYQRRLHILSDTATPAMR